MINFNGRLLPEREFNPGLKNRAFKYGDSIFDTLKWENGLLFFLEDHYFRLMSSMRMLRIKIPLNFTLEYYEAQIRKTLDESLENKNARIRVSVYRADGGYYAPETNESNFLIEVAPIEKPKYENYEIELYKDFPVASGLLSTIKTNNRIINVLASVYAKENAYQNCILINEKKEVVEAINSNIFLIRGNEVITPPLDSGCINGIVRKKLIEGLKKRDDLKVFELAVSPFDLLKADEIFLTNSISEIQSVDQYRKKRYSQEKTKEIQAFFYSDIKK
jgi:branched-chain amino acid aminotransferase